MDIDQLIKTLKKYKQSGIKHISTNSLGFCSFHLSGKPIPIKDKCYITIYSQDFDDREKPIKGKHYENIPCEISSLDIRVNDHGQFEATADLVNTKPLPEWYDSEDQITDFYKVPIDQLCDNEFWLQSSWE